MLQIPEITQESPTKPSFVENQTSEPTRLEIWEHITRDDVRANQDKIFLFGDNLTGFGYGGQAKEMRGEENAVGIPTKKAPNNNPNSFFSDKELAANRQAIDEAFNRISPEKIIVIPKAGLGTGLAQLSEKAPNTFAYLNEKLAEIGFNNQTKETTKTFVSRSAGENKVVVQSLTENSPTAKRLLDLNNIQTASLQLLSPTEKEIDALKNNKQQALAEYADRLRANYKINKEGFRDGLKLLSDSLDKGEQITVACSCRNGGMCHADVVKMAIEKVNIHIKNGQVQETIKNDRSENHSNFQDNSKINSKNHEQKLNPRTQRAINEILAVSENDLILEKINQTDGRNRSEQASYLGKSSQVVRDIYERGGMVVDGKLIVPQEKLTITEPLVITTESYAVKRIGEILQNESKAKEIAPIVVEYGNKIAGAVTDGETKLKVFSWIYDSLDGKSDFLARDETGHTRETRTFEDALEKISVLAEEMHSLEPIDKIEFVPLAGFEQTEQHKSVFDAKGENLNLEDIYEDAISREENEKIEPSLNDQPEHEQANNLEPSGKINTEGYERIELETNVPRIPENFTQTEITRLLTETLPEIDHKLENGVSVKEILKPYNEIVWQSVKDDTLNRLETIYQKQKINEIEAKLVDVNLTERQKEKLESEKLRMQAAVLTPTQEYLREILVYSLENSSIEQTKVADSVKAKTITQVAGKNAELSQNVKEQIAKIDLRRQNIIELKSPNEYKLAEETAVNTFYQTSKQKIGNLLTKLDEIREKSINAGDKTEENALKKELNQIQQSKPSYAFKLENSSEIIVGAPSDKSIQDRNFVSSYVDYELKQPETRLRFENERYRIYAATLETAKNRNDVIKISSEIRAENAKIGMKWKDLEKSEKEKLSRPLAQKEMQFLFTESSPAHYTSEMTAIRLSYSHAGTSRRSITESLIKGEIKPSPEVLQLINSLESRLERRELKDSILATKHFFESVKTPNELLKYKNEFDHREIYRSLPPQEKDFVYFKATQQKENLEYRLAYKQRQLIKDNEVNRDEKPKPEISKTEKSFYLLSEFNQARVLGEKIESSVSVQKEISERDVHTIAVLLNNQSVERLELISQELRQSANLENKKIGEVLETFSKAEISKDEKKTVVQIKLPENRLIEVEIYRELLQKFYPDDELETSKYKFSSVGEKNVSRALKKGQDETIQNLREEINNNVYRQDVQATVFLNEKAVIEKIDKIKQFQGEARFALRENENILEKYAVRANAKMQNLKSSVPSSINQKEIVLIALGGKSLNTASNKAGDQFLQAVQKEITISDLNKFAANDKFLGKIKTNIKKEFAEISRDVNAMEESKFKSEGERDQNLYQTYQQIQQTEENRQLSNAARNAFETSKVVEGITISDLVDQNEKEKIKSESHSKAKTALESDYKPFEEKEYNEQALKMADKLEKAHLLAKQDASASEVAKAFEAAEKEKNIFGNFVAQEFSESKPLSLRVFEKELERAEKQLLTTSLNEKLSGNVGLEKEKNINSATVFSSRERDQIKVRAFEITKERLEPKELDANNRKISPEASRQAFSTYKQLERASNLFQTSDDKSKITEAFFKLDREAAQLFQIRQDYNRAEKLALLRDGIKSDIVDFMKKNPNIKTNDLVECTSRILTQNLSKFSTPQNPPTNQLVNILTREITEKIEKKQNMMTLKITNQYQNRNLQLSEHSVEKLQMKASKIANLTNEKSYQMSR